MIPIALHIFWIIILIPLIYQDLTSRSVSLWLLIALLVSIPFEIISGEEVYWEEITLGNLTLIVLPLLLLFGYTIYAKRNYFELIGLGDVLLFAWLFFALHPFYVMILFFSLLITSVVLKNRLKDKSIPFVSYIGLIFITLEVFSFINKTSILQLP